MAYEARKNDDLSKEEQKARNDANNTNNVRNAADVAIATGNPYGVVAGAAVKGADAVTGGKALEAIGKALTTTNNVAPGGNRMQNASNRLNESGVSDTAGKVARIKNSAEGGKQPNTTTQASKQPSEGSQIVSKMPDGSNKNYVQPSQQTVSNQEGKGREQSLPSSSEKKEIKKEKRTLPPEDEVEEKNGFGKGLTKFLATQTIMTVTFIAAPIILIVLLFVVALSSISGLFSEYEDAFGISYEIGEETGGLVIEEPTKDQKKFYERITEVKQEYQTTGKILDPLKIVAVHHVLDSEGANLDYKKVTKSVIKEWADAMFSGNMYNESLFKQNLINTIIPKYLPNLSQKQREELADEVFDYIDRYYNLIGKEANLSSCASIGNCTYEIKGFFIPNKGNVVMNIQVNNLKVRLMECGAPYGNGSYTKPIDQDLVNFEDYVAGVAYAEVGPNADPDVLKAQMVAARSFALARPTGMGYSAGKSLTQENGQWILQISSCVADQVFCNIDQGCSYMGGGDGQGGIVRSGMLPNAYKTRDPIPQEHPLRTAAAETQGEVLVNKQGYIIETGYTSVEQNNWAAMAKSGYNYKQMLLQTYSQSPKNFGASNIEKMSCSTEDNSNCISTGEFAQWKQTDPQWSSVPMGDSGKTIGQIGCLATSIAIQIAKSGVDVDPSIKPFNPGTFVEFLNRTNGFAPGGNFVWASATKAAPSFRYAGEIYLLGMDRSQKLRRIQEVVAQKGVYAVAEVKGNTGQHWVAIDSVDGSTINMMDPSSDATDMWQQYNWANTSRIVYFQVG